MTDKNHSDSYQLLIDRAVIIRTVTHAFTGRLTQVTDYDVVIYDQAWIAEAGRWNEALMGKWDSNAEIEAYPDDTPTVIPRGAIVEMTLFRGELPRKTV